MFKNTYSLLSVFSELNKVHGRKKLQKMVHLLEVSGVDLPFKYEYHFYGPYSADLQEEVNFLVQQGFISEIFEDGKYIYSITEKGQQFKQALEVSEDFRNNISTELLSFLNKESSQFLEVVSTYAYLIDLGYDAEDAKVKVRELKPHLERLLDNAIDYYYKHLAN